MNRNGYSLFSSVLAEEEVRRKFHNDFFYAFGHILTEGHT